MRNSFAIALLLVGTCCLISVQPQCQESIAVQFEAFYVRIIRIGEDSYEEFDEGTMAYDAIGERFALVTNPNSQRRRVAKEFICKDSSKTTGFKSVAVLLNGQCEERTGRFFDLTVPHVDDYKGQVNAGGPGEEMTESIYFGESTRERNDFILTTSRCGPVEIAFSDQARDFHLRMNFYNLTTSFPYDAFIINCAGQSATECAASIDF